MIETSHSPPASKTGYGPPFPTQRPGGVFWRTLRDNLIGILVWGGAFGALIVTVVVLFPILEDRNTLLGIVSGLGFLETMAASYAVNTEALGTFSGYLAFQAIGWAPHILSVYVVPHAIGAIMIEERQGTLDLLLGTPITRWQLMVEKVLAMTVSLIGILLIMWLILVISTTIAGVAFTLGQATAGIWHIFPITLVTMAATLLLSVILHDPRTVSGLAALYIALSYFIHSLANATEAPALLFAQRFSIYGYYSSINTMTNGINWMNDLGLVLVAVGLFGLAIWRFQKRDIGV